MDILLTGGGGQLGIELRRAAWPAPMRLHAPDRAALDLADPAAIRRMMSERSWAAVLSCGAYTAVDRAETDVATAWAVNALAPAILAELTAQAQIPIVQVSTDYVFSGAKLSLYEEDDPVSPISVYGASKEGGEQAIRTANPRHLILRTAWVMSAHRSNFLRTVLRLAGERSEVRIVADQLGSPTVARDLAAAIRDVTVRFLRDPDAPVGTYHVVNAGEASWANVAEAIFAASSRLGGPSAKVIPIGSADYPTPARRPMNSRLTTARLARDFGVAPRPWREAIDDAVADCLRADDAARERP